MSTTSIMIVGVGGQGTLLASKLLGNVLLGAGYDVKLSEVHGMSQRGGSVVTYVKYGDKVYSPIVDQGEADYILSFEILESARWISYLKAGGQSARPQGGLRAQAQSAGPQDAPETRDQPERQARGGQSARPQGGLRAQAQSAEPQDAPETRDQAERQARGGHLITNTQRTWPMPVITGAMPYPENIVEKLSALADVTAVDALALAEQAGSAKAVNVVLIGVLSQRMDIPEAAWLKAIEETVPPKFLELNKRAFELGRNA